MKTFFLSSTLTCCILAASPVLSRAQIFTPGGAVGLTTNPITGNVGVKLNTPTTDFEVNGRGKFNEAVFTSTAPNDGVFITNPAAEQGMSMFRAPFLNRADVRFDGNNIRMLAGVGFGPPAATSGITVSTAGNVGLGVSTPGTFRLNVDGTVKMSNLSSAVANTKVLTLNTSTNEVQVVTLGSSLSNMITGTGTTNFIPLWTGSNTQGNSMLYNSTTTVSIGTTSPSGANRFQVNGPASSAIYTTAIAANMNSVNTTAGTEVKGFNADVHNNGIDIGYDASVGGTGDVSYGFRSVASGSAIDNKGIQTSASGGNNSYGGHFHADGADIVKGVYGTSTGTGNSPSESYGGDFEAKNAETTVGVHADADGSSPSTILNYGVKTLAHDGFINMGIEAGATNPDPSTTNLGIYAYISGGTPGTIGGFGSFAGYFDAGGPGLGAGFFNGDVWLTGSDNFISDRKFKENINPVGNIMDKIMQLNPATYTFKDKKEFPSFNFATGKQYGFIAQELETVFPELVKEGVNPAKFDEKGAKTIDAVSFKGVTYQELIPILTAGIQEQQKQIAAKDAKINELEERISRLEQQNSPTSVGNTQVPGTAALLYQNVPNPFSQVTEIRYKLPGNFTDAKIIIFDMNGKQIRNISLQGSGDGHITISSSELSAGMYLYSLLVNGQEIDTKRMILTQ